MLAAGGVVLTNCTDAATAYPDLWRTREAEEGDPAGKGRQLGHSSTADGDNPV
jgi:hypothetical protein